MTDTTDAIDMTAAEARLHVFADTIGIEPPATLLCPDGGPSRDLVTFCRRTGCSLDWVFCGSVQQMIRDSYALAQRRL